MKKLTAAVFVTLGIAAASLPWGCNGKRVAHSGENPLYPLRGLHAALPCEGCHGPGTPQKLPTACIDCHDDDRPDPTHNPGQDCYGCHVEDGWDIVETTYPIPTADTATPGTLFDHSLLPATQLCWDCHEVDRLDPTHYTDKAEPLLSWDCQGCHTTVAWDDNAIEHPTRVPHGGRVGQDPKTLQVDCAPSPEAQWQVGCEGCHPGGDTTTFVCFACHPDSHGGPGGTWAESACLGCHIAGEPQACAP